MTKRPNILFIYTDQQRWDALGAAGNAEIHTPNLDRLASLGSRFDHCYVQNPVCMPSRISMWSSRYPSSLGITHMGVPVPEDLVTLPRLMGAQGYHCATIGKLHFLPHANRDHREAHPDYGFHHLQVSDEPGPYEDAYRAWVRRKAPDELDKVSVGLPLNAEEWRRIMKVKDGIRHFPQRAEPGAYAFEGRDDLTHSAFVGENTVEFLESIGKRPFLCVAGFFAPHSPWVVPDRYLELYHPDKLTIHQPPEGWQPPEGVTCPSEEAVRSVYQGYYAMVSEVDHYVGLILDTLDREGLSENTIVVFTSDHGEWLGAHGRFGKGYPGDDCISRVPCLIRFPRSMAIAPGVASEIIEAVDLVPTLLEACGVQAPPAMQGRSLLPVLRGLEPGRESALMEGAGWKSLRTSTHRYVIQVDGRESLFDLERDPGEYRDVASLHENRDLLAGLRHQLATRLIAMERPLPRVWTY